jgi:site-specific DNA recombinase
VSDADRPRLRALIYNRASADQTGQRVSVDSQDRENRDFCARQGWDVAATVTDNDRSASRWASKRREGYVEVKNGLADGRWGRIDVLVTWESSRAQRDLSAYVDVRDLCERHNVLFAYKGRVYDLSTGDDRFTTGLDALLDERNAEEARDRTLRSHRRSVQEGRPRSFTPYGYMREYAQVRGKLVVLKQKPDPVTSAVVDRIVTRILAGDTLYAIAQELNTDEVLPPRAHQAQQAERPVAHTGWTPTILRNLLSKPSLMGMRTHHGAIVGEATWPAIVDPGDWARVQALLNSPQRPTARTRAAAHLLSGIAECGVCGGWMRPLMNRGRMTYACAGVNPTASKGHVVRSSAYLDAWVMVQVGTYLASPQLREWLVPRPELPESQAVAARKLDGLRAQLADYEAKAVAGEISASGFGRIETGLLAQIAVLERETTVPVLPPVVAAVAGAGAEHRFAALPLVEQRRVVRAVCRVVVHRSARRGVRGFDPSTVDVRWAGAG